MDYKELLTKVNKDFNVELTVYKEKAGNLMLNPYGALGNWDCGHSCPSRTPYVNLPNGYGYALINDQWFLVPDGVIGWRQKEQSEFEKTLEPMADNFRF
jgi:hypothetical protein